MSKISTYSLADTPLSLSDRLIGTEAFRTTPTPTPLATKNFSLGELLQLFSANFPAASLQAVLNTGNTATQNINLTGTIDVTLIKPDNIEDTSGSQGTVFQYLSKGASSINWVDLPIDTLQAVLNAGNTATQNITLVGDITTTKIIPGNIQDDTAGIGTTGQFLSKTASGIRWVNSPTATTPTLGDVVSVGNTANQDIFINGLTIGKGSGTGATNTALGSSALLLSTTGYFNVATGAFTLTNNTTGNRNTALGYGALYQNLTGNLNVAIGSYASLNSQTGLANVALGYATLNANLIGSFNTGLGYRALFSNLADKNTAVGTEVMFSNTTGTFNTVVGQEALRTNLAGSFNSIVGNFALLNAEASYVSALGRDAGRFSFAGNLTTASESIFVGYNSKSLNTSSVNEIVIGANAVGLGNNTIVLGSDSIVTTALTGNVGIGTKAPLNVLDVVKNQAGSTRINIENTDAAGTSTLRFTKAGGAAAALFENASNQFTFQNATNSGTLRFQTTTAGGSTLTALTVDSNQNIEINNNLRVTGAIYDSTNSPGTAGQFLASTVTGTDWVDSSAVSGTIPHATATGTDVYVATIAGVTAYGDGEAYLIRFPNGNTTGCTLNINALGAVPLYRNNDGALIGGDIWGGGEMLCTYNSTLNIFQCIGTSPNSLFSYITNADSVAITKGQPVYAFGGTGDRLTVKRAFNTSDAGSARTIGVVVTSSIAVNQKGIIIIEGLLDGLNILPTATWSDGDTVYLGTTAGSITNIKQYAPNHLVYLGTVTTASNGSAGRWYVKVQNGYELDELHNVQAQTPALKDTLWYDNTVTPGQWKTASIPTILGYIPFNLPSLTSGSVLFSNGTTIAQDNAQFFWDDTNNRLGIGTTSPTGKLTIFGGQTEWGGTSSLGFLGYAGGNPIVGAIGALALTLYTNGTEKMRITSSGNVGIGTATTGSKLHALLNGNASGGPTGNVASFQNSSLGSNAYISLFGSFSAETGIIFTDESEQYKGKIGYNNNSEHMYFQTDGSERMRIASNGNVLINTTIDNGGELQVAAPGTLSTDIALKVRNSANTADLMTVNGVGQLGIDRNFGLKFLLSSVISAPSNGSILITDAAGTSFGRFQFGGTSNLFPSIKRNTTNLEFKLADDSAFTGIISATSLVGGTSLNSSAALQVDSTTKGFLPPRMTNAQRTSISLPAVGLMVYCTDATEGLYIYKSTGWTFII